jgi:hypothetical protein
MVQNRHQLRRRRGRLSDGVQTLGDRLQLVTIAREIKKSARVTARRAEISRCRH